MNRALRTCPVAIGLALLGAIAWAPPARADDDAAPSRLVAGRDSVALRHQLENAVGADVGRACGRASMPWAYRGHHGKDRVLRIPDHRHGGPVWTERFVKLLLAGTPVDSAQRAPGFELDCEKADPLPVYAIVASYREETTTLLLDFRHDTALAWDEDRPLGLIRIAAHADTLWKLLAEVLPKDPLLAASRPLPQLEPDTVQFVHVESFPVPVTRVPPRYPMRARGNDVSGTVWVQVLVGRDGNVRDAVVVQGELMLRDAALDAIWQWRFEPARSDQKPVPVWVMIPVKFTLR